ncbi:MAG: D-alanyl-D-alanine carboxypeptidase/D-alanyl-D-alanine-endopeptidase [Bacteroidetes bacterium]|nr:D-alanyl-D-alanine carboxypeptidase/D-alanyl-D-alanine-endopeptidase [Bacteroidota bacterium]
MINKSILLIICFSLNLIAQSGLIKLKNDIDKIVDDEFFNRSQIAIEIYDLTDGISLYKHNNKLLLHPASTMKLLTTAAALLYLGIDYQFTTELYHTGVIESETLYGDLFIVGGLDPDFTTDDIDSLVSIINSLGIKYITKNLYADTSVKDSVYWGKGWMWDDNPDPGAPYLSALNINDNAIEVFVDGTEVDSAALITLDPNTGYLTIENNCKTVASSEPNDLEIIRDWQNNKNTIIVNGKVRQGEIIDSSEHSEKLNLLEPDKYFLTLFKEHLEENGVEVKGDIKIENLPDNSVYLSSIRRSIDTVLTNINKESDNLSAEMLLYALALNDSGAPANAENGIEAINNLVDTIGLDHEDYLFADGSGVSRYSLVSAELLTEVLKYFYSINNNLFNIYYNSLPVAGVDGTLKKRMIGTRAENNVHAKTGTLSGVSNLSGYVTARNGNLLAFSILIQNFLDETKEARAIQDKICELLANY